MVADALTASTLTRAPAKLLSLVTSVTFMVGDASFLAVPNLNLPVLCSSTAGGGEGCTSRVQERWRPGQFLGELGSGHLPVRCRFRVGWG